jgi:MFS family permease
MTERDWRNFPILFGAGFVLAAILSIAYSWTSYFLVSVAFGLLCFGCGVVLMLCLYLWKRSKEVDELIKKQLTNIQEYSDQWKKELDELRESWKKELDELYEEKAKFEEEKEAWEAQKTGDI